MEHPDGGMLDDAMGSLVQNWNHANFARYSTLRRSRRDRCRGIITSSTGEPLAAFKMIGDGNHCGQDTLRGLVRGRIENLPSTTQIKVAGVEGFPVASGHLRVRECYPADLRIHTSFDDMMIAWRNNPDKAQALSNANELSLSAGRSRQGPNNGSIIVSCAETFTGAVEVTSGVFERTFDSLRHSRDLLMGPLKVFHIAGGFHAKELKVRLQDPDDRCEFDAIQSRQGAKKKYPAFRMRYADEE